MTKRLFQQTSVIFFILWVCAMQGCSKTAGNVPPTPEEARSALIKFVESYDFEKLPISKEFADELKSKQAIDDLKNARIVSIPEGNRTAIGPWHCNLSMRTFDRGFSTIGNDIRVYGKFELASNGRWEAVPTGQSIGDRAPR